MAGKDETLLILPIPTQQVAAMEFDGHAAAVCLRSSRRRASGTERAVRKAGQFLSLPLWLGAPSRQAANKVLDQVGYESNVTWDEPKQTLTEPGINSMIVGAFMGTGAIMLFAVAAGIGFGGIRVLVKIFLPNKIFDREKQIEILQLGISSKPIKAKDFY